jgi:hypothetical protein
MPGTTGCGTDLMSRQDPSSRRCSCRDTLRWDEGELFRPSVLPRQGQNRSGPSPDLLLLADHCPANVAASAIFGLPARVPCAGDEPPGMGPRDLSCSGDWPWPAKLSAGRVLAPPARPLAVLRSSASVRHARSGFGWGLTPHLSTALQPPDGFKVLASAGYRLPLCRALIATGARRPVGHCPRHILLPFCIACWGTKAGAWRPADVCSSRVSALGPGAQALPVVALRWFCRAGVLRCWPTDCLICSGRRPALPGSGNATQQ